ncbi:MAG: serine/threonine protein kinase [Phycisphaerales bacterium]|nr:serine/threonine protein kinase [Phycisphaerales bacterium]
MTERPADSARISPAAEQVGLFGFALADDEWLARLRAAVEPKAGIRIGPFELLGEVRRGTQGVVVRARQPNTQRVIALKRPAHGRWSTAEERFRFEREVEAAVALSHPNIVTIFGLEYVDGQPLLAMEWVDGEPIDVWARGGDAGKPRPQRVLLAAFLRVCDGVHHAHQRGVIHRDLKPANISVDAGGTPKVLDFGLAKRFNFKSSEVRLTESGDFLGSPAYAAPEQLCAGPDGIDVRTDVYALGIILYELLTGRLPFQTRGGIAELFDAIRQGRPLPPSRIDQSIDGDLDAIVLKSIAPERERRYPSVDALAADLNRYLAAEPIEARRGQAGYALRKLVRRHWISLTIAGCFLGVIAVAAVALSIMYARQGHILEETAAARDAETAARRNSERVHVLLEQLLLRLAEAGRGTDVPMRRELLSQAEQMIGAELSDAREAQARAYDAIGRTYQQLALYDEAERCLRTALNLNLTLNGTESLQTAQSLSHLANLLQDRSRYPEIELLIRRALEIRTKLLGQDDPAVAESLHNLGNALSNRGQFEDALALYENAYDLRRRRLGDRSPDTINSLTAIGLAHANLDDLDAAEACFRSAVDLSVQVLGPAHRDTAGRYVGLGKILQAQGQFDEAEHYLREGLSHYRSMLGDRHDNVAWAAHRLGVLLHARGEFEESEALLRKARETYRVVLGPDDPFVGYVCDSLAALLCDTGRPGEADQLAAEAQRIRSSIDAQEAP